MRDRMPSSHDGYVLALACDAQAWFPLVQRVLMDDAVLLHARTRVTAMRRGAYNTERCNVYELCNVSKT